MPIGQSSRDSNGAPQPGLGGRRARCQKCRTVRAPDKSSTKVNPRLYRRWQHIAQPEKIGYGSGVAAAMRQKEQAPGFGWGPSPPKLRGATGPRRQASRHIPSKLQARLTRCNRGEVIRHYFDLRLLFRALTRSPHIPTDLLWPYGSVANDSGRKFLFRQINPPPRPPSRAGYPVGGGKK